MFVHFSAVTADLEEVLKIPLRLYGDDEIVIRYKGHERAPGELMQISKSSRVQAKILSVPLDLGWIAEIIEQMGHTYFVETCTELKIHHPCGCITRVIWEHRDSPFLSYPNEQGHWLSRPCPTCSTGHRGGREEKRGFFNMWGTSATAQAVGK